MTESKHKLVVREVVEREATGSDYFWPAKFLKSKLDEMPEKFKTGKYYEPVEFNASAKFAKICRELGLSEEWKNEARLPAVRKGRPYYSVKLLEHAFSLWIKE